MNLILQERRNVMCGKYTENDAAKDTSTSPAKVNEAWHDARDDAAKEGGWNVPTDRHDPDSKQSSKNK